MNNLFIPFINRVQNSISSIELKGVPDKLWHVVSIITMLLIAGAYFNIKEWCLIVITVLLGLIFILAVCVYLYFMFKAPDYLRSENFHIKKQAIEVLGDKDSILPTDVAQVINMPYSRSIALPYKEEENQQ